VALNVSGRLTGANQRCLTKQQVTWRGQAASFKRQATSRRLDKLQAMGYYRI